MAQNGKSIIEGVYLDRLRGLAGELADTRNGCNNRGRSGPFCVRRLRTGKDAQKPKQTGPKVWYK